MKTNFDVILMMFLPNSAFLVGRQYLKRASRNFIFAKAKIKTDYFFTAKKYQ